MTPSADTPVPSRRLLADDVVHMPLTGVSQPGIWIDRGWPTARVEVLVKFEGTTTSVWEVTEGVVADIENDECLLVLGGAGTLRFEDGEELTLRPGLFLRLRSGERTEWTVRTVLRVLLMSGS